MKDNLYCNPLAGKIQIDRRSGCNRRDRVSIFPFSYLGPLRRKKGGRRQKDTGYVDIYDIRTWCIAIAVVILSLMDAILTRQHLLAGRARELNPIMDAVIQHGGIAAFFWFKGALTIIAVAIIMLHKEWALGRHAARICLWAYILLSLYHIYLAMCFV
jgi:heme exporter protein D